MRLLFLLFCLTLLESQFVYAQRSCSADPHQAILLQNPEYAAKFRARMAKMQAVMLERANGGRSANCANTIPLPMAFHFQGIANPDVECLRQLAADQLQILNDDYQGTNADISLWDNGAAQFFPGVSNGESCIQFCLPDNGHPTGFGLADGDPAVTVNQTGNMSFSGSWSGYINVYVRNIGALGFSPLGGNGNGDGVTVDVSAFGAGAGCAGVVPGSPYDLGRTLTHELGHYLGLRHIWGGGCNDDDGIGDTPNSSRSYGGCPNNGVASCGSVDMHMNYMDYVFDACMYMFSAGQISAQDAYAEANLQNVINNAGLCAGPAGPTSLVNFVDQEQSFAEGSSNCFSAGARIIDIPLSISAAPAADVVVTVDAFGTADNFIDYRIINPRVTFPAGQDDNQLLQLEISEDGTVEQTETIELTVTLDRSESNVVIGPQNVTVITIENDDTAPQALTTTIATAANITGGFADFALGANTTVHFYDQVNGKLMLSVINASTHDYGCTNVSVDRADEQNPGAATSAVSEVDFVTDKTFFISPENNNFSNSFTVRLYYTDAEIAGFLAEAGRNAEDIRMYKSGVDIQSEFRNMEMRLPTTVDFGEGAYYEATYTSGMSGFALGVEALALPVELVDFRAVAESKKIELDWVTAAEVDNAGFTVLRKGDNDVSFARLGWVDASGNAGGADYRFTDETAVPGRNYAYQLRQQDVDGTTTFSDVVTAAISVDGLWLRTFPNPTVDYLRVQLASEEAATVKLTSMDGRLLSHQSVAGTRDVNLDLTPFPAGVYLLVVETERHVAVRKVVYR